MNWSASVLSTVTSDTEPTIIIEFDSGKYIFNVGENTNRAFMQGRPNWKKTKGIFLTSVGTQRASGLAGMLMTLADASCGQVDVVGPQGLMHFIAAMRKYVYRDMFSVKPSELSLSEPISESSSNPIFKDENVTIYAIPVSPGATERQEQASFSGSSTFPDGLCSPAKHKRPSSPQRPSSNKRAHKSCEEVDARSQADNDLDISLENLSKSPDFNPRDLRGDLAHKWREFLVQNIFIQSKPTPNEKADPRGINAQSTSGKSKESSFQRTRGDMLKASPPSAGSSLEQRFGSSPLHSPTPYRVAYINGFNDQLPEFSLAPTVSGNTPETKSTVAYAIVGPRIRGKFDAAKAKALQIPNGAQRKFLTQGQTITFQVADDRGGMMEKTVRPEEVIGASEVPSAALILDIPTRGHIPTLIKSFQESPAFARFLSERIKDSNDCSLRIIFHLCGDNVLEDQRYIAFMNSFGSDVQHIISSRQHGPDPVSFTSAAFNQLRLSQLDPQIFRIPKYSLSPPKSLEAIPNLHAGSSIMRANARHSIRPPHPPVYDKLAEDKDLFHPSASSRIPLALSDSTAKCFQEAKDAVTLYSARGFMTETPGSEVIITPLGTSSAVPTKYRNVSSTLLRIPNRGSILLDTGEGTWGQFARHFGTDEATTPNVWDALRELKCIYISHIHADHHGGLAKILAMRCRLDPPPPDPLYLIAHSSVFLYIHEYADIEDLGINRSRKNGVKCILSDALHVNATQSPRSYGNSYHWLNVSDSHRLAGELCQLLRLKSFSTVDVQHTSKCHAALINHMEGWSAVFSGDTVPSDRLAWAGKDATLLIHEASMGDDAAETAMAKRKRHSTFGQAVDIGRRMNAENVLLTHFSARYPQMPPSGVPQPLSRDGLKQEPFLALAFDNADIKIGDMWKMNLYLQAIEQSFLDTAEEGDGEQNVNVEFDVPL